MFRTEHLGTLGDFVSSHLKLIPYTPVILYINIHCLPGGSVIKNPSANARDMGSIPGTGRYPGKGNDNLLHYSCLGNPINRGAWRTIVHGVTKELDTT